MIYFFSMQTSLVSYILNLLGIVQNARPPLPPTCPVAFSHLINRCWSSNPAKRPHFDKIVSILESYGESLELDPEFFSSFKPSSDHALLRCLPKCITRHGSPSLKA
jgi:hypothetical protein